MEHRAVLLALGVLAVALALAAIDSQVPAADPFSTSAKNDDSEKLELVAVVADEMRVSIVAKAPKSAPPSVSENDAPLDSGLNTTTTILEPLPFSATTVPSLMVMANFSSVVTTGQAETPTRVAVAPCAVTAKSKPETPRRVVAAPRDLPWRSKPKPAAPAPQVQSSWLRPSWLQLPWSSARVEADAKLGFQSSR